MLLKWVERRDKNVKGKRSTRGTINITANYTDDRVRENVNLVYWGLVSWERVWY